MPPGAAIFLVALIVVSIFTIRISDAVLNSQIGALDRTLGFAFGAVRGFLLCAIAFIFFNWLAPETANPTPNSAGAFRKQWLEIRAACRCSRRRAINCCRFCPTIPTA